MLKKWIAQKKVKWLLKWADEFGLYVVRIQASAGTEYLVDQHGAWRRLARAKVPPNAGVTGAEPKAERPR